jgi:hypothetical protein
MLVPYDVQEIKLGVEYIIKSVGGGEINRPERRYHIDRDGMRRPVHWLKKSSFVEQVISIPGILFVPQHELDVINTTKSEYKYVCIKLPQSKCPKFEAAAASLVLSTK